MGESARHSRLAMVPVRHQHRRAELVRWRRRESKVRKLFQGSKGNHGMNKSQIIKLTIKPNSHRIIVSLGQAVTLFCSAQYNFMLGKINMAGIKIQPYSVNFSSEQDVFEISSDDAAKLMNRLARRTFNGSIGLATPAIQTKWDTRVSFIAKDFE